MPETFEDMLARVMLDRDSGEITTLDEVRRERRGEWTHTHTDLLGQEVVILSAKPVKTQFGPGYVCETLVAGEILSVLFGAQVLVNDIEMCLDKLPLTAIIVREKRYYEFR